MITPRLNCIVNYVNADVVADIGTDHAYIPIELINKGLAKKVIACDIRKGPLKIAESHIKKYGLEDKIETRLGSGFSVLIPKEADIIITAGMGGELIENIIKSDENVARNSVLVLQPMNSQYELRKYLLHNNFIIECEDIETEGNRVYNIMVVKSGTQEPYINDIDYHLPQCLYNNKKFPALIDKKQREFTKIIKGLEISINCDLKKLNYYMERLKDLEKIKNGIC